MSEKENFIHHKGTKKKGHSKEYTYDASGNVQTMTDPEGTVISFNYDDNGNVLSKTSTRTTPTGTETLTTINVYDHLGRIVENVDAGGNVSKVEYNAIGKQACLRGIHAERQTRLSHRISLRCPR